MTRFLETEGASDAGAEAPVARPLRGRVAAEPALGDRGLPRPTNFAAFVAAMPRRAGLILIRGYQLLISPLLVAISGPGSGCRFHPTCSHYAAGAIEKHGLVAGSWLAVRRLAKCHPWHPGGVDPVPEQSPLTLNAVLGQDGVLIPVRTRSSKLLQIFKPFTKIRHDRPPFRGAVHPHG